MTHPVISGRGRDDDFRHLAPSGDIGIDRPGDLDPFDVETGIQVVEEVVRTVGIAQQELAVTGDRNDEIAKPELLVVIEHLRRIIIELGSWTDRTVRRVEIDKRTPRISLRMHEKSPSRISTRRRTSLSARIVSLSHIRGVR